MQKLIASAAVAALVCTGSVASAQVVLSSSTFEVNGVDDMMNPTRDGYTYSYTYQGSGSSSASASIDDGIGFGGTAGSQVTADFTGLSAGAGENALRFGRNRSQVIRRMAINS